MSLCTIRGGGYLFVYMYVYFNIYFEVSLNQVPPMTRCYPQNSSCYYQVPRNSAKKLWLRRNEFGSTEEADASSLSGEGLSCSVPDCAKAGQG